MSKRLFVILLLFISLLPASAQHAGYGKMSPFLRQVAREQRLQQRRQVRSAGLAASPPLQVCAFVKTTGGTAVLQENACQPLAQFGDIYIASIPVNKLHALSLDSRVVRMEAHRSNSLMMDSVALQVDALPVYAGTGLPQAYTGEGVVVGLQDVGFDLKNPNFYDTSLSNYRIRRFWDQLSTDTIGSTLYVGADYTTQAAILNYAHSRDGLIQFHGTHTLGIAAGSGYDSPYRGMAYGSDICLVSNAVSDDVSLVDSALLYKYTYATDALGFKYIFDYAKSQNKPCVISFSEGSGEDFQGYDKLYYAILDSLSGPGRIIVSSAGNLGIFKTYIHKPQGETSTGTFFYDWTKQIYYTLKSKSDFSLRMVTYGTLNDTLSLSTQQIVAEPDSEYVDTLAIEGQQYVIDAVAYPSCYQPDETVYDVSVQGPHQFGLKVPFSVEIVGREADVEMYRVQGNFVTNDKNPSLCAGDSTYSIMSPSSAPSVICVGGTSYRRSFINYLGHQQLYDNGTGGVRGVYSSVGPTFDGRIKPDVLAPGTNIISSYSSYYLESNPNANATVSNVKLFTYNGRTYAWNCNSGTSMAAPVVAGAIALWLQARPTLTVAQVKDVLAHTCTHPDPTLTYPNNHYGYGQIDVYRGLLYVLGLDGIKGISVHQPSAVKISVPGKGIVRFDFNEAPSRPFSVNVYSVSGAMVRKVKVSPSASSSYTIDLQNLANGVYAVQVNGGSAATSGSTLIRK